MSDKYARARAIGAEAAESDRQMDEINASADRAERRKQIAQAIIQDGHSDPNDIQVGDAVEYVDGGYWVTARLWVDAETVEEQLEQESVGVDYGDGNWREARQ